MRNREKYTTYTELKAAFAAFCRLRNDADRHCTSGFGRCNYNAICVLCYEMWKDADTEQEESACCDSIERRHNEYKGANTFMNKYPCLIYRKGHERFMEEDLVFESVNVSVRLRHVLERMHVSTLGEFVAIDDAQFSVQKGVGKGTLNEFLAIKDSLDRLKSDTQLQVATGDATTR